MMAITISFAIFLHMKSGSEEPRMFAGTGMNEWGEGPAGEEKPP